jgi:hypothetical protein
LRNPNDEQPAIIRCTNDAIARLAEELFRFVGRSWKVRTALGPKEINLLELRRGHDDINGFVKACRDPYTLIGILRDIAGKFSHTLLIVLDQAEETLTLARTQDEAQTSFFDFLKVFNATSLNVKLVISLRIERFGEFFRFLRFDASAVTDVKHYLLENLDGKEIKEAIARPSSLG